MKINNTAVEDVTIIFHKTRTDAAREYEQEEIRTILQKLASTLHSRSPIKKIEVGTDTPKNHAGKIKNYDITLKVTLMSGDVFIAHGKSNISKTKGVGLRSALREGFADIEAELRKTRYKYNDSKVYNQ